MGSPPCRQGRASSKDPPARNSAPTCALLLAPLDAWPICFFDLTESWTAPSGLKVPAQPGGSLAWAERLRRRRMATRTTLKHRELRLWKRKAPQNGLTPRRAKRIAPHAVARAKYASRRHFCLDTRHYSSDRCRLIPDSALRTCATPWNDSAISEIVEQGLLHRSAAYLIGPGGHWWEQRPMPGEIDRALRRPLPATQASPRHGLWAYLSMKSARQHNPC